MNQQAAMNPDFDRVIDRRGTHSSKWDNMEARTRAHGDDAIAMWTADMDFLAAEPIRARLRDLAEFGVFGYYARDESWREAICGWAKSRHGWEVDPDWIRRAPGVCAGLSFAIQAFSEPGEGVVVFAPVYHAFASVIRANGRRLVEAPLATAQGRYRMDLEEAGRILPADARVVVLCNPHNPGGAVWTVEELRALGDFCVERGLIVISDEIWRDIVFSPARFTPMALAAPQAADRLIALTAASKTFNLAGGSTSETIIADPDLRRRYTDAAKASHSFEYNLFGTLLAETAYNEGAPWLDALLPYLDANLRHFGAEISKAVPGARAMAPESTYLSWIDFTGVDLSHDEVARRIGEVARIGVSAGETFGLGGPGWQRFNLACPRATVDAALERLADAFADLR